MKKLLLISAALFVGTFVGNAQNQPHVLITSNKAYKIMRNLPTDLNLSAPAASQNTKPFSSTLLGSKLLGITCYELQSNCAMPRNIINYPDSTLSFTWTIDDACATGNANRGSGYNYWDGTKLLILNGATKRIESERTGFSRIATLGNGKEIIFAHKETPYDFLMSANDGKGTNTWTGTNANATTLLPDTGKTPTHALWNRIAIGGKDGKTIHLLSCYTTDAGKALGVTEPIVYSRSLDAGATWINKSVMLPEYDSTRTYRGSGEAYAIDADDDSVVAIVYAGLDNDVTLWKSTNDGNSFTKTFVDKWAFAPSIDSTGTKDDIGETNDGSVTTVVDPHGIVHVAYPTCRIKVGGYYPTDAGLVYWNDSAKKKIPIPVAVSDIDAIINGGNNTGAWEYGQYTAAINANAASTPPNARYGNRAFLTIPSISVDGKNVFILFSLVSDGDSTQDGQSFRDIWVVASQDGGATFGKIQNITCTQGEEEFFISLAKRVDNKLHFMYDVDGEPGTNIQNGDPIGPSELRYATIDKERVLLGTASCGYNAIVEHRAAFFSVSNNYPNPAHNYTYLDITMKKNASVSFVIFNNLGQQVYITTKKLVTGKQTLSVDVSEFPEGLYFYTVSSSNAVVSGKITVAK